MADNAWSTRGNKTIEIKMKEIRVKNEWWETMFDVMKIPDNITTSGNKTIEMKMKEILLKNE